MNTARKPDIKPGHAQEDQDPARERQGDDAVDEAVEDTFPASDPPAWTTDTGSGAPDQKNGRKPG